MVKAVDQGHMLIKVTSGDTYVFILLLHHIHKCSMTAAVVVEWPSIQSNGVDIAASVDDVPQLVSAHALSGCNVEANMVGVGKGTVQKVLQKGLKLQHLGDPRADWGDIFSGNIQVHNSTL